LFTSELGVCPNCGWPTLPGGATTRPCRSQSSLSRVRALGLYRTPFPGLVHALKYSSKTRLALTLGHALAALAGQDTELAAADAVCAVPLHPARLRERGYNQSELLAQVVAADLGKPLVSPIVRRKNTRTQTAIQSEQERIENLRDAFAVKPGVKLAGQQLILVDDVTTSGATLDAAGKRLLAAGASAVLGLVVAAAVH